MTFANAVVNQQARTTNGMKARQGSANACVDLFYKIGASRGKDITPDFVAALVENQELALRIAQWARDVRGGAGERQTFRSILQYLEKNNPELAVKLAVKVPEIGRFDDLFSFKTNQLRTVAFTIISEALKAGNGLAAKWTPRKGQDAVDFRSFLGWTPKFYRKTLVTLTKVVEQQMCAKNWDNINFSHVPSVAASRYKKAFYRNTTKYAEYIAKLVKGDDPTVKVNASAVFPHDVLKGLIHGYGHDFNPDQLAFITKQWEALPNYVGNSKVLPMVDVSGSMFCPVGGNRALQCIEIAISLGLYCADKNTGAFKDIFLTFSNAPRLERLSGNIVQKVNQLREADWGMNTNLHAAFDKVLQAAVNGNVAASDMPNTMLIMSDMQFDACTRFDDTAMQMIRRKYEAAGYTMPNIVFWNLNAYDNVPAKSNEFGVALISGFSPSILKAVLSNDMSEFTPEAVMLEAVMVERYAV